MKYYSLSAKDLTPQHIDRWLTIRNENSYLCSPYFHPDFTRSVASVRNDVYVGIIENKGVIEGFWPYHRNFGGIARPVGLGLSDYQGIITRSSLDFSVEELMRGCGLKRLIFDHLVTEQKQFSPYHTNIYESPLIDVSKGFDGFLEQLKASGRKQFKEVQRKNKKLEEQIGSVSFTLHTEKEEILDVMMQWKSEQCKNTGTVDYFSIDWCVRLIKLLNSIRKDDFGGMLSCLYAGEKLAAVHFGMYTDKVWHYWFPSYNHELEEYSPGSILLYEIIKEAAEQKKQYIDLGKGTSLYKKRVMTGSIQIADGSIVLSSFINSMIGLRDEIETYTKKSFLKPVFKIPGRVIKMIEKESRFK